MPIVYAQSTCATQNPATGLLVSLHANEPWDADDPFVRARPDLFTDSPQLRRTVDGPVIESATKAPGEKRAVKRVAL